MAGRVNDVQLSTKRDRSRLVPRTQPYWRELRPGLHLGLAKSGRAAALWRSRRTLGVGTGRYVETTIGTAEDDLNEANGFDVLDFGQAVKAAVAWAEKAAAPAILAVREAASRYCDWLTSHRKPSAAYKTRLAFKRRLLPVLGEKKVLDLTRRALEQWLAHQVRHSDDPERVRRSKDTANRVLSMLKAALNRATADPANGIPRDFRPWADVERFRGVSRPREHHFSPAQARQLIASCPDDDFRDLLIGAFLLGTRYGEMMIMEVKHFAAERGTVTVPDGKTGPRTIAVSKQAQGFLTRLAEGRARNEPLFRRADGGRWLPSIQDRRMKKALAAAGLDPKATFYSCRHTHASRAIEAGVPLLALARAMGTSVRMLETTYAHLLAEREQEFAERGSIDLQLRAA